MRGLTVIEVLIVLAIIGIILALAGAPFITIAPHYSDGERTGTVVKLSNKGLIWKTWDGQMNLGAFDVQQGGVMSPVVWEFTISPEHPELVPVIQEAAQNGKRITLHYEQALKRAPIYGSPYWVTGVAEKP